MLNVGAAIQTSRYLSLRQCLHKDNKESVAIGMSEELNDSVEVSNTLGFLIYI